MSKPYLSASQMDMLCRCGEQYRRRYVENDIIPPGIAMLKGTGLHGAAEANMRQKIDSHVDLPVQDIVETAVETFKTQLHGGYSLSEAEESVGATKVLSEAIDDLATMADVHATEQAPDYQPTMVEQAVRIELPGERDLLGIIDLADDQHRVVDFKTSKRKKRQTDADDSVQLTVYAASYQAVVQHPPSLVRLDTVVSTKTRCERQVLNSQRDGKDFAALAARINMATQAIAKGVFLPAAPGSWACSPAYCGYWNSCGFVNAARTAAAKDDN